MIASGAQESPSTVRKFPKVKPYAYAIVLPTGIFVIAAPREVHQCYAPCRHVTIAPTALPRYLQRMSTIHIIGGGLAGSEAAWQAAQAGSRVVLHEMRPAPDDRGAYRRGLGRAGVLEFFPLR